jgi:large subunit ribosomal protein L17
VKHNVYGAHLGRNKNQRTALFKGLVQSLFLSESIQTTESKAKAVKGLVDKIINQAKDTSSRRLMSQFLTAKTTQDKLVKDLLPRLKDRNSGYTTVVRLGSRQGDGAMMVKMSLLLAEAKKETKAAKEEKVAEPKAVKTEAKGEKV